MLLKETTCHIGVHGLCGGPEEDLQSLLKISGFFTVLNARGEELLEVLERELVHWVHFAEGSHYKVHHRTCSRTQDSGSMRDSQLSSRVVSDESTILP